MKRLAMFGSALVVASGLALVGGRPAAGAVTVVQCPPTGSNSLASAIAAAAPGSQIVIYGTCTGNFTLTKNVTLIGEKHAALDGNNSGTVLTVNTGVTAVVDNLTIQHGNAANEGGILNLGNLTLNSSSVSSNVASDSAAGIDTETGNLTLNSSTVSNNVAANRGGGIFQSNGSVSLNASSVFANSAGTGAGMYENGGSLVLSSSTVSNNTATSDGGGIFNNGATVTLKGSTVSGNQPDNCAPPGSVPGCTG